MIWSYIILNFREMIVFRLSFLMNLFQRLFNSFEFIIFWLIIANFDLGTTIGTWKLNDLLFLIAFYELNFGMFMILGVGFFSLPYVVPSGKLDDILVLPVDPSVGIIGDNLAPDRFVRIFVALILLISAIILNPMVDPLLLILGIVIAIGGSLVENLFFMTLNLLSFWTGNVGAVVESLTELDDAKRFPLDSVSRSTRLILTFLVPVVFISSFPAEVITMRVSPTDLLWGIGSLVVLFIIWFKLFGLLWGYGLKNYQSGGSL